MAIDDLIPEDIDCVYAAKLMAPHLELKVQECPEPSKAHKAKWAVYGILYKGLMGIAGAGIFLSETFYILTHPKYWKKEREERRQLREEMKERKRMGLKSRDEEMAQRLNDLRDADEKELEQKLADAGVLMPQGREAFTVAHCAGLYLNRYLRHPERNNTYAGEVTIMGRVFPDEVRVPQAKFEDMLKHAIEDGEHCVQQGYIINPDFNETATSFLLPEIYSRLEKGNRFNLLEAVNIGMDEQQRIYLRRLTE